MARKSNIDKAAETGDWSKLEKDARKALRKSGAVLGHSQADPDAEQEIEAAETESEDVEAILDPSDDIEDELAEPEEPQDDPDEIEEGESPEPERASISPPGWPRNYVSVSRYSSTSEYYLAGRAAAEEQEQLERKQAYWANLLAQCGYDTSPLAERLRAEAYKRLFAGIENSFGVNAWAKWKQHVERRSFSVLHGTNLRIGHPKRAPNRQITDPYYGYEPQKVGRPPSEKAMTPAERKRMQRAKERERKKIAVQSARLADLSARLEKFRPAVAA